MRKKIKDYNDAFDPLKRKTFRAALTVELRKQIPSLGELTAEALAARLEELFGKFFPPTERLRIGQILWPAVDEKETGGYGKRIEQTQMQPVMLDVITTDDIADLLAGKRKKEIRKKVAVRLFEQAKKQQGVLTGVDVAAILRLAPTTVYKYVKEQEKETGRLVPRRGTIHDMGPSITHKKEICRQVILEGKSVEQTARDTRHSPEAVTRYVLDYRRVHACLEGGFSIAQTAYATKMSQRLVKEYDQLLKQNTLPNHTEDDIN